MPAEEQLDQVLAVVRDVLGSDVEEERWKDLEPRPGHVDYVVGEIERLAAGLES